MHVSPSKGPEGELGPVAIPSIVPLFPLPHLVFFPRTYLPLHIFEPRYREMVEYALSTHQMIGMVLLKEGWEIDYEGSPPIHSMGCVGRIVNVQRLQDGRFNILLQGLRRVEVKEEVGVESFRRGRVVVKEVALSKTELPMNLRTEVIKAVSGIIRTQEESIGLSALLQQSLQDDVLIQNLSFGLNFTPLEKQFLLESESLLQQARRLLELLQFKAYERNDQVGWG
jgi:uncharacterized protein